MVENLMEQSSKSLPSNDFVSERLAFGGQHAFLGSQFAMDRDSEEHSKLFGVENPLHVSQAVVALWTGFVVPKNRPYK